MILPLLFKLSILRSAVATSPKFKVPKLFISQMAPSIDCSTFNVAPACKTNPPPTRAALSLAKWASCKCSLPTVSLARAWPFRPCAITVNSGNLFLPEQFTTPVVLSTKCNCLQFLGEHPLKVISPLAVTYKPALTPADCSVCNNVSTPTKISLPTLLTLNAPCNIAKFFANTNSFAVAKSLSVPLNGSITSMLPILPSGSIRTI